LPHLSGKHLANAISEVRTAFQSKEEKRYMNIILTRNAMLLVLGLATVGCAEESFDGAMSASEERTTDLSALQVPANTPDPSKIYLKSITPIGHGCRSDSSQAWVSADGEVFTVTFSEYLLELTPADRDKTIDCQLNIGVHVPNGYSTAVTAFTYQGYARLDLGVTASQSAAYSWHGRISTMKEARREVTGPLDSSYTITDNVNARSLALDFLPCDGQSRNLVVRTSLTLTQALSRKRYGYINMSSADAQTNRRASFQFRLQKRLCSTL
jgi:hypothetical protein